MKNPVEIFSRFLAVIGIILIILILASCKLFHESEKRSDIKKVSSDTTSISKSQTSKDNIDTSRNKTEKINTKETVYYPQPIIVKGDDGKSQVVFVPQSVKETSNEKTEQWIYQMQRFLENKFDSLSKNQNSETSKTEKETKTKAGIDWIQIGIIVLIALFVIEKFPNIYTKFINILKPKKINL